MDSRVTLLKDFSRSFVAGKAKIEAEHFGFQFLEWLVSGGSTLEYGELTNTRLLHKYKLVDISNSKMDELLRMHIAKECNVCRYFGAENNDVLCFNLDNNHKTDNTEIIPEMSVAVRVLRDCLVGVKCEPLIVASGRGYHVWLRFDEPLENELLYTFMLNSAARALHALHVGGYDYHTVKFSFYPDINVNDVVSLRLFGSEHVRNKVFSRVLTPDGLLDEAASWQYFEDFMRSKTTSSAVFRSALETLRLSG